MSRRTNFRGQAISCVMLSMILSVCQLHAEGDEFWDGTFGIPGSNGGGVGTVCVVSNSVYFGGNFSSIGGVSATNVARWNAGTWSSLGSGLQGVVDALASEGRFVYAGGLIYDSGSGPLGNIARWDGMSWTAVGGGMNGIVFALTSDGTNIYAGGHFTEAGGVPASKVAKWDGEQWSALGAGIIPVYEPNDWVGAVDSLAVSGNDLYVGGRFRNAGGIAATNIARWDGTNWHALGNGLRYYNGSGSENGGVDALAVHNGLLFAGGSFWRAGDVAATNIARWDGQAWASLGSGVNDRFVVSVLALNGEDLYAGGVFMSVGGVAARRIARWDGDQWWPLGSGVGQGLGEGVLALAANGSELFVGGQFTTAGGKPSLNAALWHIPHSLTIDSESDAVRLSWPATGTNFTLETKDDLQATTWSEVPQPPALLDSELVVTQSVSGASQLYRLHRR